MTKPKENSNNLKTLIIVAAIVVIVPVLALGGLYLYSQFQMNRLKSNGNSNTTDFCASVWMPFVTCKEGYTQGCVYKDCKCDDQRELKNIRVDGCIKENDTNTQYSLDGVCKKACKQ